jgi:hypothetical protein
MDEASLTSSYREQAKRRLERAEAAVDMTKLGAPRAIRQKAYRWLEVATAIAQEWGVAGGAQ